MSRRLVAYGRVVWRRFWHCANNDHRDSLYTNTAFYFGYRCSDCHRFEALGTVCGYMDCPKVKA
jgi:hypothetical protein